ncbi:hypothetical protein CAI21_18405 [Alkalilimnicola ehrlichii]|uniref:Tetratricopeptide repeat protein n=1 Tax=Alkalilimnicola ehrlichii TaxID=351052 RepID=A0A3E0WIQ9_9GAMM|nr:hypothetical protein [Alkalilimnicola ehrlichii]RFA25741.1 hypothetical protein CAI21_18405 [Alkalilimnicola ehrlichii]RFA32824.1 hypothetical protein CAL65_18655 [Alkalilimnicola ehrlichii]
MSFPAERVMYARQFILGHHVVRSWLALFACLFLAPSLTQAADNDHGIYLSFHEIRFPIPQHIARVTGDDTRLVGTLTGAQTIEIHRCYRFGTAATGCRDTPSPEHLPLIPKSSHASTVSEHAPGQFRLWIVGQSNPALLFDVRLDGFNPEEIENLTRRVTVKSQWQAPDYASDVIPCDDNAMAECAFHNALRVASAYHDTPGWTLHAYELAKTALALNRLELAEALGKTLTGMERRFQVFNALAERHFAAGDFAAAETAIKNIHTASGKPDYLLLAYARHAYRLYQAGHHEQASSLMNKRFQREERNDLAREWMRDFSHRQRWETALHLLRSIGVTHHRSWEAYPIIQAAVKADRVDIAEEAIDILRPQYKRYAYPFMAVLLLRHGHGEQALEIIRGELSPQDEEVAWTSIILELGRLGLFAEALEIVDTIDQTPAIEQSALATLVVATWRRDKHFHDIATQKYLSQIPHSDTEQSLLAADMVLDFENATTVAQSFTSWSALQQAAEVFTALAPADVRDELLYRLADRATTLLAENRVYSPSAAHYIAIANWFAVDDERFGATWLIDTLATIKDEIPPLHPTLELEPLVTEWIASGHAAKALELVEQLQAPQQADYSLVLAERLLDDGQAKLARPLLLSACERLARSLSATNTEITLLRCVERWVEHFDAAHLQQRLNADVTATVPSKRRLQIENVFHVAAQTHAQALTLIAKHEPGLAQVKAYSDLARRLAARH